MKIKVNVITSIEMEVPNKFQFLDIPYEAFSMLPKETQSVINDLKDELSAYVNPNLPKDSEVYCVESVNGNCLYKN